MGRCPVTIVTVLGMVAALVAATFVIDCAYEFESGLHRSMLRALGLTIAMLTGALSQ